MTSVAHEIRIGGLGKDELLAALHASGVALNAAARDLFADERFAVHPAASVLRLVEVPVEDLGFPRGGTMPEILRVAGGGGLAPCPLEVGPHLRLKLIDQEEGCTGLPEQRHCAPPGSITVVSSPIGPEDETPKGFYLRRINGTPWLRGYHSDDTHVWSAKDRLVLCLANPCAHSRS
jgi:hypothetical protein